MKAKYFDQKNGMNKEQIEEAGQIIRKGGLVVFPTETVYGIGANALSEGATKKIFQAKGRASDNPLIVHISHIEMLKDLVVEPTLLEKKLMDQFWPGPLTIILKRKNKQVIPDTVTAGLDTVGIRMPNHPVAQELIKKSQVPIAAPSANVSGRPSGTDLKDIIQELGDKVDCMIDTGIVEIGVESTVIQVVDEKIRILRPGKITKEELEKIAKEVEIDKNILGIVAENEKVASPGMKYRHYAPNTKCILVYSQDERKMITKIQEMMKDVNLPVVLCRDSHISFYQTDYVIGMGESLEDIAKNIFTVLRKVDQYHADLVLIEGVGTDGLGLAIKNRLIRACEHQYIEI